MLGTGRLLSFSFRALVLLILLPLLWLTVADRYNDALVVSAQILLPSDISLDTLGSKIIVDQSGINSSVSIEGYTLHYGLILLAVLVLAAVGIGIVPRIGWLLGLGIVTYLLHVVGVALLARGIAWASGSGSGEGAGTLVFSLFAIFWGLLPPIIGGAWAFLYRLPRTSERGAQSPLSRDSTDTTPG